jgi:ubiquinone/menaquinone biosynthesis C-methylase UbiE
VSRVILNEAEAVQAQYATEANLDLRRSVWMPTLDGRHPGCEALATIEAARPSSVLEVGCGTGEFASRVVSALPDADVVAIDQSERLVDLTASRGVTARQADVQFLPFADASFDAVAAMWMLYHVPDLHRGLAEIRRVLRPGGTFVAVTNGDQHLAQLRRDAGGTPALTTFSSENGEASLRQHFTDVRREDFASRAVFPDHATAVAYLASSAEAVPWLLPHFDGPREYVGHVTMFVAG